MVKTQKHLEKKRHGLHHKQSHRYHKVYWPYLPGALVLVLSFALIWIQPRTSGNVLSYSSNISESSLLSATNHQRSQKGVGSLRINGSLSKAAQAKAADMAGRNYWSHKTPEGKDPWIFIDSAGYRYDKAGENLAYGFDSSDETIAGWMNSSSHRANLLDSSYSEVGFGFANSPDYNDDGPETVIVALYAQPKVRAAAAAVPEPDNTENSSVQAVTSTSPFSEPATKTVALVEVMTGGDVPWAFFAVGMVSGVATSGLLLRHGLKLRKLLKKGEKLVLHHPVYDTALILVIIATVVLSKGVGFVR